MCWKSAVLSLQLILVISVMPGRSQREPSLPIRPSSFSRFNRFVESVPSGRSATIDDVYIRFYEGTNVTGPSSFRLAGISRLLDHPHFDMKKPTVLYAHGYAELASDKSVQRVMSAYLRRGDHNTLLLDWSNLSFGNYINVAMDVAMIGKEAARAVARLLRQGLELKNLHFVGHSLGAHVIAYAARSLAARGMKIPRLTGLDPAYPGFYPPIFGEPMSKADASFVDVLHTDGGGYGAPAATGHADFWPNGGQAKQPGCLSATLLLTKEDFCSHWRSWSFWAESVEGGRFVARRCDSYDSFLRARCQLDPVPMGLGATPGLKGNFYLRTAAKRPYALGIKGAS